MRRCLLALLFLGGACSQNPGARTAASAGNVPPAPSVDLSLCDPSGKRVSELDTDGDGRSDVWKFYMTPSGGSGEVLVCKKVDLNHDGKVDAYAYFDAAGNRVLDQYDLDFDSRIDSTMYYDSGKRVRTELDTNFDNKPDIWKYYEATQLVRLERDVNHDGRVDYWEYYEGGRLQRIGYDTTGSGKVDRWDRAPEDAEGGEMAEPTTAQSEPTPNKGTPGLAPGQTPPKKEKEKK